MYCIRMKSLKEIRDRRGLSQRRLAQQAGVSFRALQMIEAGQTDMRLSSLGKIATALGTPEAVVRAELERLIAIEPDSVVAVSRRIHADGETSWKLWLFEFVDAFRRAPRTDLVVAPPSPETSTRVSALLASTVEALCAERDVPCPWWCGGVGVLPEPWFVAGIENLKAIALAESPAYFRKRNIFVLANFLSRA
jgi:transcriptional regulator with XRE-family HTH domain